VLAASCIVLTAPPASAQYIEILKTTTSKNGKSVDFPKTNAEITAAVVELPPGSVRPRTTHPWPRYVYVLEGTLTVGGDDGKDTEYPAGSLLVTQNSWDIPKNVGDKMVKVLVIDAAEAGMSNSIVNDKKWLATKKLWILRVAPLLKYVQFRRVFGASIDKEVGSARVGWDRSAYCVVPAVDVAMPGGMIDGVPCIAARHDRWSESWIDENGVGYWRKTYS
jgi:quercetin dioxygenase-like cupin family protein